MGTRKTWARSRNRRYDRGEAHAWGAGLCLELDLNTSERGELSPEQKIKIALLAVDRFYRRHVSATTLPREDIEQATILGALKAKVKSEFCYGQQVCYLYRYAHERMVSFVKSERKHTRRVKAFSEADDALNGRLVDCEYEKQAKKLDCDYYLDQVRNSLSTDKQRFVFDKTRQSGKFNLSEIARENGVSRQAVNLTWQAICRRAKESIQYLG